jgi:hypothetical protein
MPWMLSGNIFLMSRCQDTNEVMNETTGLLRRSKQMLKVAALSNVSVGGCYAKSWVQQHEREVKESLAK